MKRRVGESMANKRSSNRPGYDDAMLLLGVLNAPVGESARDGMELLWTYGGPRRSTPSHASTQSVLANTSR